MLLMPLLSSVSATLTQSFPGDELPATDEKLNRLTKVITPNLAKFFIEFISLLLITSLSRNDRLID
ncbi:hypothetical protein SVI_0035 [Shewanella violacea DSS12]|uniref:Uncharacterized protein n=1 Tax=Shewanella violacea (strain JCM 10179 / CIP 106290 / LMG 19151 / DSS12) TaxID=637905 RepID=D4ZD84_SHEVD|nr:hypothetical protein SVI_0035 [Shewanella violacea DSS12]